MAPSSEMSGAPEERPDAAVGETRCWISLGEVVEDRVINRGFPEKGVPQKLENPSING